MLMKLKKSQSTAEYAILFALVVAAAMGVQSHVKKSLQAKVYDATRFYDTETAAIGSTGQWEGVQTDRTTTGQKAERTFREDYTSDTPFSYNETNEANVTSTTIQ
ncbi:MAG: hypothetical protein PHV17_07060 [Candidatus Omnitrophica bacterium]|nr:hypothetical protein [Candidatus Omnitrophota bacterium]